MKKVWEWGRFTIILVVIFLFFRFGIGFQFIQGHSMEPTIGDRSVLLINKITSKPKRNDIIVTEDHNGNSIIKRIIGLPNDEVVIQNGIVYINNEPLKERFTKGVSFDIPKVTLKRDEYFIMGDNRTSGESLDSRSDVIGPISGKEIKGEALFAIFPFGQLD